MVEQGLPYGKDLPDTEDVAAYLEGETGNDMALVLRGEPAVPPSSSGPWPMGCV